MRSIKRTSIALVALRPTFIAHAEPAHAKTPPYHAA